MTYNFAMSGASGRMGRSIIALANSSENKNLILSGAIENAKSTSISKDAGQLAGIGNLGVLISKNKEIALEKAEVLIDFSAPQASLELAKLCSKKKIPCVIGTTGFNKDQQKEMVLLAKDIPILIASNMSLGVNLLFHLTNVCSELIGKDFNTEILELHHLHKKDAPSGTALSLRDIIKSKEAYKNSKDVFGRNGIGDGRSQDEIGIHAMRGGDVIGDHTVFFLGDGVVLGFLC